MCIFDAWVRANVEVRGLKAGLLALGVLLLLMPGRGVPEDDLTAQPFEELLLREYVTA